MSLQLTPEEADRWEAHKNSTGITSTNGRQSSRSKLDPEKALRIRSMLSDGESKNRIMKRVSTGSETVDKIRRQMKREGIL